MDRIEERALNNSWMLQYIAVNNRKIDRRLKGNKRLNTIKQVDLTYIQITLP